MECNVRIQPGEIYEYVSGVWDHRGASIHTCIVCAELREEVKAALPVRDWPCYGQLYDIVMYEEL
jgi:hypothetical protein